MKNKERVEHDAQTYKWNVIPFKLNFIKTNLKKQNKTKTQIKRKQKNDVNEFTEGEKTRKKSTRHWPPIQPINKYTQFSLKNKRITKKKTGETKRSTYQTFCKETKSVNRIETKETAM